MGGWRFASIGNSGGGRQISAHGGVGDIVATCLQDASGDYPMPRNLLTRAALAAVLGWGVWAGLARAGGSDLYPRTPSAATTLPPGHPPVDSSPSKTPLKDWILYKRPLGCWASFNGYGCGSLRSECTFLFGGCRSFWGEPCLKGAPPSPLPPWAGRESGYWQPPPGSPADREMSGQTNLRRTGCSTCPQ